MLADGHAAAREATIDRWNASDRPRVVITGGGTAGHTNPGIAVAEALVRRGLDASAIRFVGAERGSESELVPAAGFQIEVLPGRGIKRTLSPAGVRDNVGAVIGLVKAGVRARSLLAAWQPEVVVCLGGYAAVAASLAARAAGIPVVVTEQNARSSATNRLVSRFAAVCALPFPDTDLPNGVVTGNPTRHTVIDAVRSADREGARAERGWPTDAVVLAVWGGSLGARSINTAVADTIETLASRTAGRPVIVHHVIGRRDWDGDPGRRIGDLDWRRQEYEHDMASVLVGADLAVTRGGASTVAELALAGLPAVIVPLPIAPRDHQRANAEELSAVGAAVILDDAEVGDRLLDLVAPLLADDADRARRAAAAASVARPDAASAVADLVLDRAEPSGPTDQEAS